MKMAEYNEIPVGQRGDSFIRKQIRNVFRNPKTQEVEGTVIISVEAFHQRRPLTKMEQLLKKVGY
jgi:hypothetical protein